MVNVVVTEPLAAGCTSSGDTKPHPGYVGDESERPTMSLKPPVDVTVIPASVGAAVCPAATVTVGTVMVKAGVVVVSEGVLERGLLVSRVFPS